MFPSQALPAAQESPEGATMCFPYGVFRPHRTDPGAAARPSGAKNKKTAEQQAFTKRAKAHGADPGGHPERQVPAIHIKQPGRLSVDVSLCGPVCGSLFQIVVSLEVNTQMKKDVDRTVKKGNKYIASCPYCGSNILRSSGGDVEVRCSRCKKDLIIVVRGGGVMVRENLPAEVPAMVAEDFAPYEA